MKIERLAALDHLEDLRGPTTSGTNNSWVNTALYVANAIGIGQSIDDMEAMRQGKGDAAVLRLLNTVWRDFKPGELDRSRTHIATRYRLSSSQTETGAASLPSASGFRIRAVIWHPPGHFCATVFAWDGPQLAYAKHYDDRVDPESPATWAADAIPTAMSDFDGVGRDLLILEQSEEPFVAAQKEIERLMLFVLTDSEAMKTKTFGSPWRRRAAAKSALLY